MPAPGDLGCALHSGTDTVETSYTSVTASSVADCCAKCTGAAPKCSFASFGRVKQGGSGTCWLKAGSTMTPGPKGGITLIVVKGGLPPKPPAPPRPPAPPLPAPPSLTTAAIDLTSKATTPLSHYWKASVGSGHARLGLRKDWQQQLAAVSRDIGITGVRFHGLFDDDMNVMTRATNCTLLYLPQYSARGEHLIYMSCESFNFRIVIWGPFMTYCFTGVGTTGRQSTSFGQHSRSVTSSGVFGGKCVGFALISALSIQTS